MSAQSPLTVASVFVVPVVTLVAFAVWVYRDASLRGSAHPLAWALTTAASGVVGVVYVGVRRRVGERTASRTRGERTALAAWVAGFLAFAVASVLAPPDPFTQGRYATGLFVLSMPIVYVTVLYFERT